MPSAELGALGLIAGRGTLPLDVARSARRSGRRVAAVAIRGLADRRLEDEAQVTWLHLGEVGAALAALRAGGVREAVLAGKVPKQSLLDDFGALRLDERAAALVAGLADRRDDAVLSLVAELLEAAGIRLLPQTALVSELLAGEGVLGSVRPTPAQLADVAFGFQVAKALGSFDIGQTVVVRDHVVLAVEALEGTDAAVRRGGALARGACVVKVAKPGQDPRFDLPAIGPDTLAALDEAGAALLAVEAGETLLLERERLLEAADAAGVALLGVSGGRLPEAPQ